MASAFRLHTIPWIPYWVRQLVKIQIHKTCHLANNLLKKSIAVIITRNLDPNTYLIHWSGFKTTELADRPKFKSLIAWRHSNNCIMHKWIKNSTAHSTHQTKCYLKVHPATYWTVILQDMICLPKSLQKNLTNVCLQFNTTLIIIAWQTKEGWI